MKLKQLFDGVEGVEIRGKKDIDILGLSFDSRVLAPGYLFIAKKGAKFDGSNFILQAISSGAKAVVTQVFDPFIPVTQIVCSSPEKIEPLLAAKFFGFPSKKLFCVGVTGTKGKTTTSYLCRHLLNKIGSSCGLLSTIETLIADFRIESALTTHDAILNQKFLREMVVKKCESAVIEVSSHGLSQGRVDEIEFDVGIFTNLFPDHLDYHKTIQEYAEAKKILFNKVNNSIINADSPWGSFMQSKGSVLTYAIDQKADLQAKNIHYDVDGICFDVDGVSFKVPLIGPFNVLNALAALCVGICRGKSLKDLEGVFDDFPKVPGRFEKVPNSKNIHVIVDYAHTGESLAQVLSLIRSICRKKIYVVFGCGGERDPFRRQTMAQAAEKYADLSIVTTDNPRKEDPENICKEILKGFRDFGNVQVILDRKEAIEHALSLAKEDDFVLIAGKGHEKVQIFSNKTVTFDDVTVALECLEKSRESVK